MTLTIDAFVGGIYQTNTFLVADPEGGEAIIIDAADGVTVEVATALQQRGLTPKAIVLTHTHWDHIADGAAMRRALGVPLWANTFAASLFAAADGSLAAPGQDDFEPFVPDGVLDEADTVTLGAHTFTVLFTPGHEPAHIALWGEADAVLLSGDVLFPRGHGRTDIGGADQLVMNQTLRRLGRLPGETVVYPGHGAPTTIAAELPWITALHS